MSDALICDNCGKTVKPDPHYAWNYVTWFVVDVQGGDAHNRWATPYPHHYCSRACLAEWEGPAKGGPKIEAVTNPTITVEIDSPDVDPEEVGKQIVEAIQRYQRSNGGAAA